MIGPDSNPTNSNPFNGKSLRGYAQSGRRIKPSLLPVEERGMQMTTSNQEQNETQMGRITPSVDLSLPPSLATPIIAQWTHEQRPF